MMMTTIWTGIIRRDKITIKNMFTEDQLLKLLRVQSNIGPNEFEKLFGSQGRSLFNIFARENWNLVSFLFNKINGDNRRKLLDYVNTEIEKQ